MPNRPETQRRVETIDATTSAREAARRMREARVGSLVVVDEQGRALSIVTDRDLALHVLRAGLDPATVPALADGAPAPVTASVGLSPHELARRMRAEGVRRLPLVDERGVVVGIVAADDILCTFADQLGLLAETVERAVDRELGTPAALPSLGKE